MRGCSKRASTLLKGMEQQLYGNKGESLGLREVSCESTPVDDDDICRR